MHRQTVFDFGGALIWTGNVACAEFDSYPRTKYPKLFVSEYSSPRRLFPNSTTLGAAVAEAIYMAGMCAEPHSHPPFIFSAPRACSLDHLWGQRPQTRGQMSSGLRVAAVVCVRQGGER